MIGVLILCGAVWVAGAVFDRPRRQRWMVIALIWALAFFVFRVPGDLKSDNARLWSALVTGLSCKS